MKGLNEVKLIGNLGSEPEMRFTPTGKPVTTFSLATSRKYKDDQGALVEDTTWHNIVCWNKLAENVNHSLEKGSAVYVSGRISNTSWEGQDGQKHYKTEIVANDCIFLDKPKPGSVPPGIAKDRVFTNSPGDKMLADASAKVKQSKLAAAAVAAGAELVEETEIPF